MGMKCANCGKGVMIGHNVSHAKNRTRKIFKPNLHSARISFGGTNKRVRLCTKCLRVLKGTNKKTRSSSLEKVQDNQQVEMSSAAPVASGLV